MIEVAGAIASCACVNFFAHRDSAHCSMLCAASQQRQQSQVRGQRYTRSAQTTRVSTSSSYQAGCCNGSGVALLLLLCKYELKLWRSLPGESTCRPQTHVRRTTVKPGWQAIGHTPCAPVAWYAGNPGMSAYYVPYMEQLSALSSVPLRVSCVTHLGLGARSRKALTLQDEIQHKAAYLREHVLQPDRPPCVLIGHSIGRVP